jgi:hypothetical protein
VRRGAASCRAVLRSWPVTAAAGVVTAEPSSVAECRGRCDPSEVAPPAGGRRRGGRSGCPDTGHAVRRSVRILCPPCGQTSVQRVGRTSDVHASSVHATGVMRMSGQTGVRCPRPLQPCCPHRAGSRNAPVPRDWPRWAHRVRRVAVVGERLGRRCPNRACREGWSCVGQCVAGTSGDGRPGPPLRTGKGGGAALTAWATKGAGAALGAGRVAGGHGKEQVRTRRSADASRTGCRRGARHGAGPGGGDHGEWSLRWCWSRVVWLRRAHPVRRGAACGRSAAAVCQERCPLGANSALSCENGGGRDRV